MKKGIWIIVTALLSLGAIAVIVDRIDGKKENLMQHS